MKNKKKIILFIAIALLVVIGCILAIIFINNNKEKKKIEDTNNSITSTVEEFNATTDRNQKLNILSDFKIEYESYLETETTSDMVSKYETEIANMTNYFISDYDTTIEENTLDISSVDNISKIEEAKANLEALLDTITTESDIVLNDENELSTYETTINDLITSYDARIEELNEIEEEKEEVTTETTTEEVEEDTTTESVVETTEATSNTTESYAEKPTEEYVEPTTEAPTTEATTQAPAPSGHTCASASSPASNFLECINHGAWWKSYTDYTSGQTTYFDQYGWVYYSNGSWTGLNRYTNPDL